MSESTQRVGSAVFWSVFARAGRFVLSLVSGIIIVRGLGVHDYGVLSLVRTVLLFSGLIAGAGLGQAILKFLPALRVSGDARGAVRLAQKVVVIQALVWILLLIVVYFSRSGFDKVFGFEHFEGVGDIILIAVALSLFELSINLISNILSACYDTKRFCLVAFANHSLLIVLLIFLLRAGAGVLGVLVATAVGNLFATVLLLGSTARHFSSGSGETGGAGIEDRRLFRFSLPFAVIGILNIIVWRQSETLFLAHYRSAAETGFFDLAYRVPQMMLEFVPTAVWPIIMAGFSEVYEKDKANIVTAIEKYYKVLFLLCAPICLSGIIFGGKAIPILFGEAMAPAALPTQLFFGIFTISFFSTPLSMSLYVIEKTHINLLIYIALAVINVGLDIILIPRYGLAGAIFPVGLVILLSPFVYGFALSRFLREFRIPFRFIGKCFLASLPIFLLWPFVLRIENIYQLLMAVVAGIFILIISFKRFKVLGKEEIELLENVPFPAANQFLRFMGS